MKKLKALTKRRIQVGMRVIDTDGMTGTVKEGHDGHNIYVIYDNKKGTGLYCVIPTCEEYEPRSELFELFEYEKLHKFGKRTVESLDSSELKRLRSRCEARKEPIRTIAKAFNIGGGTLTAYARANKWKLSSKGKVYAHEKR